MEPPHESAEARIIPLFPDATGRAGRPPTRAVTPDAPDRQDVDRLLHLETFAEPRPGEDEEIAHVRSVELAASSGAFFPHVPTEDVPQAAARLGIRTIEVMLQTAGEYAPEFIAVLARNARDAGVRIHAVHTFESLHRMLNPYPRRVAEGRELFRRGIDAAATLGADVLVWHGPTRHEVSSDDGWERFIALSGELAKECGQAGVTLGIENVSRCALSQVRHVVTFAKRLGEIGSPEEIGFVFDPFQAAEAGANPFMMLAAMGNRIVDVHISDYREHDPSQRHLPPGDGDLPWPALVRAIAGSGYSGPIMIEGPLGHGDEVMERIRQRFNPLIRSVFPFSPDEHRHEGDQESTLPDGVLEGIALFNQRRFFEQHEVIEHEWHAERGSIRRLYQGILQIGVGFYHALNGNHRGAISLLTDGITKTASFQPEARGVNTAKLVREARACLNQIIALGPDRIGEFDASRIPKIELL